MVKIGGATRIGSSRLKPYGSPCPFEGETLIQHISYAGGERQPHWAAIASAIPWNVVERSFHLSFEGGR